MRALLPLLALSAAVGIVWSQIPSEPVELPPLAPPVQPVARFDPNAQVQQVQAPPAGQLPATFDVRQRLTVYVPPGYGSLPSGNYGVDVMNSLEPNTGALIPNGTWSWGRIDLGYGFAATKHPDGTVDFTLFYIFPGDTVVRPFCDQHRVNPADGTWTPHNAAVRFPGATGPFVVSQL